MPRIREQWSITLPPEMAAWIDDKVRRRVFANRSHAIEVCVLEKMDEEVRQPPTEK